MRIEIIKPTRCWSFVKEEKNFQLVGVTFCCNYAGGEEILSDEHDSFIWVDAQEIIDGEYPSWLKKEITAALEVRNSD